MLSEAGRTSYDVACSLLTVIGETQSESEFFRNIMLEN